VRDRDQRLEQLFLNPSATTSTQVVRILEESARYNIGDIRRTVNHREHRDDGDAAAQSRHRRAHRRAIRTGLFSSRLQLLAWFVGQIDDPDVGF
jgi:hypothetical protein